MLGKVFSWAADVEADGGQVPTDLDPLFYADRWNRLTDEEIVRLVRWFERTAPGDY